MEAIIRTDNRTLFEGLVHFLQSLQITVETKDATSTDNREKISTTNRRNDKKYPFKGTVLKDEDPFGTATDINDWEVLK